MRSRLALIVLFTAALLATFPSTGRAQDDPGVDGAEELSVPSPLDGLREAAVRAKLGDPTLARTEGAGAFWTYRLPSCALFVYFADEGPGLRVTGVAAGPRRHGDPAPEVLSCIDQAGRARSATPPTPAAAQP